MNPTDSTEAEVTLPDIVESGTESRVRTSHGDAAGDWLCAWCLNRVANERDRFKYESRDEFTFSNPEGIRFDIITFSQTAGCRDAGVPTLHLYGPVAISKFGPWGDPARHRTLAAAWACVPCNRLDWPAADLRFHGCLPAITVERVLSEALAMLEDWRT